jgi:hypothetical protein
VVTELLDAVGECGIGEHQPDALQRPIDASLGRRRPEGFRGRRAADESLERLAVVVAEGRDGGTELVVRRRPQRPVEQPEGLQAGLHLVHGPPSYRGDASTAGSRLRPRLGRWEEQDGSRQWMNRQRRRATPG